MFEGGMSVYFRAITVSLFISLFMIFYLIVQLCVEY